jgi:beta-lactamase class C
LRLNLIFIFFAAYIFTLYRCIPAPPDETNIELNTMVDYQHPQYTQADSLTRYLISVADSFGCPGMAITLVADTSILVQQGHGFANLIEGTKIDENTNFRIASLSKSFATLTAKILESEGKLNFSDKVTQYIPYLKFKDHVLTDNLTISHILSMSTGLPTHSYTNLVESSLSLEEIIPGFSSVKPIYPLGQYCTYQNASFGLIEKIISSNTGKNYQEVLNEKVLSPLNLSASTTCDDFMGSKNFAWPHKFRYEDSTYVLDGFNQKYYNLVSAGGINASISDMSKYLLFLINGDGNIIPSLALNDLFHERVPLLPEKRSFEDWEYVDNVHYGYGWRILKLKNGSKWIFHGGYVNRYQSLVVFSPKLKIGLSILFNSDCPLARDVMKIFIEMFEDLPELILEENPTI